MQHLVAIDQIESRAHHIGLTLGDIATAAGIARSTAYRAARGDNDSRRSTERRLSEALIAKERELLAHLIRLHGEEAA